MNLVVGGVVSIGITVALLAGGCKPGSASAGTTKPTSSPSIIPGARKSIVITSKEFGQDKPLPKANMKDGRNASPSLTWSSGPPETLSYAILVEDPDAPRNPAYVHWIAVGIPAKINSIKSDVPRDPVPATLMGGIQGKNDRGLLGYEGPNPKAGPLVHHYHFRVLALDIMPALEAGFSAKDMAASLKGHVIAEGVLVGTVERTGP
jgi:Raf kinase inhibitor-like YbhB/YbcL family protein